MDSFANLLIRPARPKYDPAKDLGPYSFFLGGKEMQRIDFDVYNSYKEQIKCSLYAPKTLKGSIYPCVVHCHGNCGNRTEALELVDYLLAENMLVCSFDFSGCGLSTGEVVTLGYKEKGDLRAVIKYLRQLAFISDIGIHGRSMGASTAILYALEDPKLAGLCLDSPFSNLSVLCRDQIMSYKTLGALFGDYFYNNAKKIIEKRANFDIEDVSPIDAVDKLLIPALFIHGRKDKLVPIYHSRKLFKKYLGNARIHEIDMDHNDRRPKLIRDEIKAFFKQKFFELKRKNEFDLHVRQVVEQKMDTQRKNGAEDIRLERMLSNLMTMPQSDQFDVRRSIDGLDDSLEEVLREGGYKSGPGGLFGVKPRGRASFKEIGREKNMSYVHKNFTFDKDMLSKTARASSLEAKDINPPSAGYSNINKRMNDSFSEGLDGFC